MRATGYKKTVLAACLLLIGSAASADPVLVRFGFKPTGSVADFRAVFDRANALADQITPKSTATAALASDSFHGNRVGGVSVLLEYEDASAWAAERARQDASDEWARMMGEVAQVATLEYAGMSSIVYRSANWKPLTGGEVVAIFGFSGSAQRLAEFAEKADKLADKLKLGSAVTVLAPMFNGSLVGSTTVLVRYDSLKDWAAAVEKGGESEEWGKLFAGFPEDLEPRYEGLSTIVP